MPIPPPSPHCAWRVAALACAACGTAGSVPALAHDPDATLEPVTVRTERDAAIGSTDAASRGAVDVARIQARPALRPADVLEWIPGMVVTQHSGDGKANQYFLRGFNLDHGTDFATSVAGVPVNLPTHAHGHGYTDLNFVVPEWVDRIEWRKGPYSALDGDFSAAGAADLRLRSQLARPMGQVTLGGNGYRRLLGAASSHVGDGHLLLGVEALANDGPWEVPQQARRTNLLARWSAGTAADGHDLALMGYDARWTSSDQVPQRAIDAGTIGRYGSLDPTTGGDSSRWSLSGGWRRSLQDGRVEASAWVLRYRLNLFSNFTYALDRPDAATSSSRPMRAPPTGCGSRGPGGRPSGACRRRPRSACRRARTASTSGCTTRRRASGSRRCAPTASPRRRRGCSPSTRPSGPSACAPSRVCASTGRTTASTPRCPTTAVERRPRSRRRSSRW